ncbi:hypothetical protein ABFV83_05435 [Lacrimispora sp. BS-2]|uniref:Uncharacterized protein n=1 Tax=Lacrimispora sp. BS-2 TaxID=3151850 RepID=A0AAU7PS93_9FIRM
MIVWVQVPSPALLSKRDWNVLWETTGHFQYFKGFKELLLVKKKNDFMAVIFGGEALCSPFFMDKKQQTVNQSIVAIYTRYIPVFSFILFLTLFLIFSAESRINFQLP